MKKTLVVGLDAACWDYLNPLLSTGSMPTLQRLIDRGIKGTLRSTMPATTPTAWGSIITGKNPGKHGVFSHLHRIPGTYEFLPINSHLRLGTPFWKRLNEQNVKVGLVNVPYTHPHDPVDSFVVGGFGTPPSAAGITYPESILDWIEQEYGPYHPSVDTGALKSASPQEIFEHDRAYQKNQVQIAVKLAEMHQIEVLVINLMLLDHANHKMPQMDLVERAMVESDKDLEYLINSFKPQNVMLISDHGSRRVHGEFLLYKWLTDQGYYARTLRDKQEQKNALNWILMTRQQNKNCNSRIMDKITRKISLGIYQLLPKSGKDRFWESIEQQIPGAREFVEMSSKTDYSRSMVFPESAYAGLLYLNIAGREPQGLLPAASVDQFLTQIIEKLSEVKDPYNGEPIFPHVYSKDVLYTGNASDSAPEVILDCYDTVWGIRATAGGARLEKSHDQYFVDNVDEYGFHSRDGIYIFSGHDFLTGTDNKIRSVMDIPITLLYLYDIPIPEDLDGEVLTNLINPEVTDQRTIRYQPGDPILSASSEKIYSPEETDALYERLRALGYVD